MQMEKIAELQNPMLGSRLGGRGDNPDQSTKGASPANVGL